MEDKSTLSPEEHHPAADLALEWLVEFMKKDMMKYLLIRESLASTALSGNRMAEIVSGTLERIDAGQPVSDRYMLIFKLTIRCTWDPRRCLYPLPLNRLDPQGIQLVQLL